MPKPMMYNATTVHANQFTGPNGEATRMIVVWLALPHMPIQMTASGLWLAALDLDALGDDDTDGAFRDAALEIWDPRSAPLGGSPTKTQKWNYVDPDANDTQGVSIVRRLEFAFDPAGNIDTEPNNGARIAVIAGMGPSWRMIAAWTPLHRPWLHT